MVETCPPGNNLCCVFFRKSSFVVCTNKFYYQMEFCCSIKYLVLQEKPNNFLCFGYHSSRMYYESFSSSLVPKRKFKCITIYRILLSLRIFQVAKGLVCKTYAHLLLFSVVCFVTTKRQLHLRNKLSAKLPCYCNVGVMQLTAEAYWSMIPKQSTAMSIEAIDYMNSPPLCEKRYELWGLHLV